MPKRVGQMAITLTPDFMLANIARDTIMGSVMSRSGFRPVLDSLNGMRLRMTEDPLYKDYIANGGIEGSGGVYQRGKRSLAVPLASLGVKIQGSRVLLENSGNDDDNKTLILGKFKDNEALAQAYQELERKLGDREAPKLPDTLKARPQGDAPDLGTSAKAQASAQLLDAVNAMIDPASQR